MFPALYLLKDAVALALVLKAPQGFLYGFFVAYFYEYHVITTLSRKPSLSNFSAA
ncbi:MAG: hypothetical protein FD189_1659 [Elusimicrobia bacterium]|nr:MAG: hypothetical protein FD154_735 [Elusimicrobiota bacterium]KAF0154854.1 MAG: hypothetical protein FD189_1659 [Elusimicrobiota bacterium]